jgi:hypothetical protein
MRMRPGLLHALLALRALGLRSALVHTTAHYSHCISTQGRLLIVPSRHPEFNRARESARQS